MSEEIALRLCRRKNKLPFAQKKLRGKEGTAQTLPPSDFDKLPFLLGMSFALARSCCSLTSSP